MGIGVMASIDEMWFHQILGWHHFYDGATPAIGLMTDGLLHAFELLSLTAGFFLIIGLHRRREIDWRWLGAGFLMGMGAFQVLDGLLIHKVLRLHQIRYGVPLLPYDLAWNVLGTVLFVMGLVLMRRARRSSEAATERAAS